MSSARSLGSYELREEATAGRSGSVHLAWDSCDEREVQVHLLNFGELGPRMRRRFEAEAQALMALDHPNLVHVLDAGIDQDGAPYLVRETVAGPTLDDLLDMEGCLDPRDAAALVADVADGLQAAHDADLLHRDLVPASVVLDPDGRPRLTDFGLVRELSGDPQAIRLKGRFLGTAGYLAPEQARAEFDGLSVRTDVHGLGALLFALLTGHPPSSARTLIEAVDTLHVPPPAPSSRRPDLPARLDAIVLRCLAKEPAQRPQSAAELARLLRGWLAGDDLAAPSPAAQRRAWLGWLGVLLVLAPAAVLVGRWRVARARDQLAAAEAPTDPTLSTVLARLRGRIPSEPAAVAREATQLADAHPDHAPAWSLAGEAALHAGDASRAEQAYGRSLALDPERVGDRLRRGELYAARGAWDPAARDALAALALRPTWRAALTLSARVALARGEPAAARDHALRLTETHADDPLGWELLAKARLALGDVTGALGAATRLRQVDAARGEALVELIADR